MIAIRQNVLFIGAALCVSILSGALPVYGATPYGNNLLAISDALQLRETCANLMKRPDANIKLPPIDPHKKSVIVVDAYSSGKLLAGYFRRAGYQVIHVHSRGEAPADYAGSFWEENFEWAIEGRVTVENLVGLFRDLDIRAVLAGSDPGVLFADELAAALAKINPRIPSNGIQIARKDKYLASELLRAHGIDAVMQKKTRSVEEALHWIHEHKLFDTHPNKIVVKPVISAGGRDVYFPTKKEELTEAMLEILKNATNAGEANEEVLLQEFLEGEEYVVNSTGGKVTDIWRYHKRYVLDEKGLWRKVYDYDELLPFDDEVGRQLRAYVEKAIEVMGRNPQLSLTEKTRPFGHDHFELMLVPNRGPVMVEDNWGRMMGTGQPLLGEFATGISSLDTIVAQVENASAFAQLPDGYKIHRNAIVVTPANLYLKPMRLNPAILDELKKIEGFLYASFNYDFESKKTVNAKGVDSSLVAPTVNLPTGVGNIWFTHEDPAKLKAAVKLIHDMEEDGRLLIPVR